MELPPPVLCHQLGIPEKRQQADGETEGRGGSENERKNERKTNWKKRRKAAYYSTYYMLYYTHTIYSASTKQAGLTEYNTLQSAWTDGRTESIFLACFLLTNLTREEEEEAK